MGGVVYTGGAQGLVLSREDTLCDTHDLVGCGCALRKEGVEEEVDDITTQKKAIKVVVL